MRYFLIVLFFMTACTQQKDSSDKVQKVYFDLASIVQMTLILMHKQNLRENCINQWCYGNKNRYSSIGKRIGNNYKLRY